MGQYYRCVNLDKQEFADPHSLGGGSKLMEHSWLLNPFVNAVVSALRIGSSWHGNRLVWAGDYMDEGLFMEQLTVKRKDDQTLYDCCRHSETSHPCIKQITPKLPDGPEPLFIYNLTRKEFVRLEGLPEEYPDDPGWCIHPLPLLTCSGNGRGGGDFRGINDYTGLWAGDCIAAAYHEPDGYKEIVPGFTERKD